MSLSGTSGWDRTFLDLSSCLAEPFCTVYELLRYRLVAPLDPNKFENQSPVPLEIFTRTMIGAGAILGACVSAVFFVPVFCGIGMLAVGCKVLRALGFAVQQDGFTHVRGLAPEKIMNFKAPQIKVATWNLCGVGGGLSLDHGGVVHWRSRLDEIVDKLRWEDPDVLILQEIYDTSLYEAIIEKLQNDYAHFFIHLGPNVLGMGSGLMVLSKYPVHQFAYESFENNDWTLNRGFSTLELKANPNDTAPCARIIGTHLVHPIESQAERYAQVAQIVNSLAKRTLPLPTVFAGDLNMERDGEGKYLKSFLRHGYIDKIPTRTPHLLSQWSKPDCKLEETIDYLSLFKHSASHNGKTLPTVKKDVSLEQVHLIEAFDSTYNTKTALSDHHGIAGTLHLPISHNRLD